jgi:hypothetical protein
MFLRGISADLRHAAASSSPAAMRIGDHLNLDGRLFVLIGLDPMGVADRKAELEDPATGERVLIPVCSLPEHQGLLDEG